MTRLKFQLDGGTVGQTDGTTTMKLRRTTAALWTASAEVLAAGEPGVESDTGKMKVGDGLTAWAGLAYV